MINPAIKTQRVTPHPQLPEHQGKERDKPGSHRKLKLDQDDLRRQKANKCSKVAPSASNAANETSDNNSKGVRQRRTDRVNQTRAYTQPTCAAPFEPWRKMVWFLWVLSRDRDMRYRFPAKLFPAKLFLPIASWFH